MNALVKYPCRSFAILVILFWHATAYGQLSANFTASPVSGCSPFVVSFTDQSTGNPTQWRWDLGNGVISTLKNPSATYFNPGTYNIKLVAIDASGTDSVIKNQLITVYANPVVNFNVSDTAGCFPLSVNFIDLSAAGNGTLTNWQWDFGDGNISTAQNPAHVYTSSGNYNITLRVTNSFGCVKSFTKTQYIKVSQGVKAAYTNSTPASCSPPITIQFTNGSTGPGPLSYLWDFGDGSSSTSVNTTHTYTTNGTYTVSLIAISPQGCRDTIKKTNLLSIGAINSNFTTPAVVCQNQSFSLNNTSSPAPSSVLWNFGDGTTSTAINPLKRYTSSGSYSIKLVNNFGGCSDSVIKQVTVSPKPKAAFDADNKLFCKTPAAVQFTSTSSNANTILWKFGDSTTSTATNPAHTYSAEGIYTVTLIVTNQSGCSDTLIKQNFIQIKKPHIELSGIPRNGCAPLTVNPQANVNSIEPVSNYVWDFGDGTTNVSATPSHTYNTTGTYTVSLVITTSGGCTDTAVFADAVRVGEK
ncbi:MAG: PKD domain-containing protein, partial [Chitinophagaceae bacterium]|nr:PKD domain-containing protein [Chitinophagaceae bacterium]